MGPLNNQSHLKQRLRNLLHSLLVICSMLLLLSLASSLVFGPKGWWLGSAIVILVVSSLPFTAKWVMQLYQATPLTPQQIPALYEIVQQLATRGGLSHQPTLYYIPSPLPIAFTSGSYRDAAIGLSDNLLRTLTPRELTAILGHEISHIRHRDIYVLAMSDSISHMTTLISFVGFFSLLAATPLMVISGMNPPWLAMLILLFTPHLNTLLQLALSRTREFDADLGSAELTHDPQALISALNKIESPRLPWIYRILLPERQATTPSLLRSHPATQDRIQRLQEISHHLEQAPSISQQQEIHLPTKRIIIRQPRRHWSGIWH